MAPPTTLPLPPNTDKLLVPTPQVRGQWRVEGQATDGSPIAMGFSVNAPEAEATVVPLKEEELITLFGNKDFVQLADDAAGLERAMNIGMYGRGDLPLADAPDPDPCDVREPPGQ